MSAKKTPVRTSNALKLPPSIASQTIEAGGFVYCSGTVAMDPETGRLIDADIQAHTVSISFSSRLVSGGTSSPVKYKVFIVVENI